MISFKIFASLVLLISINYIYCHHSSEECEEADELESPLIILKIQEQFSKMQPKLSKLQKQFLYLNKLMQLYSKKELSRILFASARSSSSQSSSSIPNTPAEQITSTAIVSSASSSTSQSAASTTTETSLINHWEFNNNLNDSAGDANLKDGVNYKFVKDRFGTEQSAVQLNNGYLVVPPGVYFHNDFTVTAWFNLNAKGLYPRIIDFGNGAGRNNVIIGFGPSNSKLSASLHENLTSIGDGTIQEINMNSWYHVAFSVSGRVGIIYIDGKATSGFTLSGDAQNLQRNYNYIGKSNWAADSLAVAIYDDIRIYNRALSAAEILNLRAIVPSAASTTTETTSTTTTLTTTAYPNPTRSIKTLDNVDVVYALAVLKNGNLLSASAQNINVWNSSSDAPIQTITGHANYVVSLFVLPNGNIVSGSADSTIKIWNSSNGALIQTLTGHVNYIYSFALLPNGNLASCSFDSTIKIWNLSTGALIQTITDHQGIVYSLAILPNGNLVSCSYDQTIKIWNSSTGALIQTLTGHTDFVYSLAILPNGNLASGSQDQTIKIWNSSTGALVRTLTGHTDYIRSLTVLPNGNLASGSYDNTIKIWNPLTGSLIQTLTGHSSYVFSLTVLQNGNLVSGSGDHKIKIWN